MQRIVILGLFCSVALSAIQVRKVFDDLNCQGNVLFEIDADLINCIVIPCSPFSLGSAIQTCETAFPAGGPAGTFVTFDNRTDAACKGAQEQVSSNCQILWIYNIVEIFSCEQMSPARFWKWFSKFYV
jgi:hypothetical protein